MNHSSRCSREFGSQLPHVKSRSHKVAGGADAGRAHLVTWMKRCCAEGLIDIAQCAAAWKKAKFSQIFLKVFEMNRVES